MRINQLLMQSTKYLRYFMMLVALHSFFVGLGLILLPSQLFTEFGYNNISENFFRVQGGVFHLVMVTAYVLVYLDPIKNKSILIFSITAKFIATIFLFSYFFAYDRVIVILLSGVGDFLMGLIILYLSIKVKILFSDKS